MGKQLKKAFIWLSGGELFLFLYVTAGQFKGSLPQIPYFDLTLFFMILATICLAYKWFVVKKRPPFANVSVLFAAFTGIVLFFIISYLYTATPNYGKEKLIDLIFKNGWLVVAAALLLDSVASIRKIFSCYFVWSAYCSIYCIMMYIKTGVAWNLTPFNTNYLSLSRYLAPACLISICYYLWGRSNWSKWALIPYGIFMYTIFLLSARSTILSFFTIFTTFFIYIFFRSDKAEVSRKKIATCFLTGCLALGLVYGTGIINNINARFSVILNEDYQSTVTAESTVSQLIEREQLDTSPPVEQDVALDERDEIYLNATEDEKRLMDLMERYGDLIYDRNTYENKGLPLPFDLILYRNAVSGSMGRLTLLTDALKGIAARPLTGWGLGGYSLITFDIDANAYPHIPFLEIWVECGILSLIVYAIFLLYPMYCLLVAFLKKQDKQFEINALALMTLFLMMVSMFSNLVAGSRALYMMFGAACNIGLWANFTPPKYVMLISNRIQSNFNKLISRTIQTKR